MITMNEKYMSKTQLKLINTAGPLFAEDGLKGTRIRAITEKAGVNVAGINYHFGNKQGLYDEIVNFVFKKFEGLILNNFWNKLPEEERTPAGIKAMIENCITELFTNLFKADHPIWYFKIIQKEINAPCKSTLIKHKDLIEGDEKAAKEIFKVIRPEATDWEVITWSNLWHAQFLSLSVLRPLQNENFKRNKANEEKYIDTSIAITKKIIISTLFEGTDY